MDGSIDAIGVNVRSTVGKIAPLLGAALGTPLAGVALALIAGAFGVNPKDVSALDGAITRDPESAIKLKTIEFEHAEILAKISSQDYSTQVDDTKDARKNANLYKDFLTHMAYLITAGFFGALLLLFLPIQINGSEKELLSMLVGMLVSKWQTIIDFFYGSSQSHGGKL